jgi:hypothetical protein
VKIRVLYSALIFVGSYLPLAVILLVQDLRYEVLRNGFCRGFWRHNVICELPLLHPRTALAALAVCSMSFCLTLIALHSFRPKAPIRVLEAKYIPAELMSYTLPYVVAFMSIGYQETGKFVGFTVFLFWMFWITHKAGQILLNPLLAVFGWRLYEVQYSFAGDTISRSGRALVQGSIEQDQRFVQIAVQDILILTPISTRK